MRNNQANLLAGRARQVDLFPLTSVEISEFSLERYLQYGGLPMIYQSDDLHAYVNTYLQALHTGESRSTKTPSR